MFPACSKKEAAPGPSGTEKQASTTPSSAAATPAETGALLAGEGGSASESSGDLQLPLHFQHRTADLDVMLKQRTVRALVFINPVSFFYTQGHPRGITYEALDEFERYINQKYKTGTLKVKVVYIPIRPGQAERALQEGLGDLLAYSVAITPAREQKFAFTTPLQSNLTHVVVTGPDLASVSTFADLSGKEVWVNPTSVYRDELQRVNDNLRSQGKAPIIIKDADKQLLDDDLIQMVNADLIPATVTTSDRAKLWTQVMPDLKAPPDLVVASEGKAGWALRKDNPQFKALLDEFIASHGIGTSFGNTLLRRYLQNTKWVKDSTSKSEIEKFNAYVQYFQKYSAEYDFDYLMMAAQGYQESLLDQSRRSPVGAVGVMQVIPKYAAAPPINIKNVNLAENNIQAGIKMMRNIADTYFKDQNIDPVNKTLMVFASYNAGPNRIARLRKEAPEQGLDPNKWFGNVELLVAKDVGQETVTYVGNIYKYYVAYKLSLEQRAAKAKAMAGAK